jgi:hypothetical protein
VRELKIRLGASITRVMQIGPVDAKNAATRTTEAGAAGHAYPTSRPPMAASSEPDPAAPSPGGAGRATATTTPPKFSHRLQEALRHEGRLADLAGGLTRHQVDRMLAGLPPGGFDGDFAHMRPDQLTALAHRDPPDGAAAPRSANTTFRG